MPEPTKRETESRNGGELEPENVVQNLESAMPEATLPLVFPVT